jgi:hypothetical protein
MGLASLSASAADEEGFEPIFNGKDLTGWDGDPRLWSVKDGAIRGETTEENKANGNTFLIYQDGKLKDFELRLSVRSTATNNSGIQYRSRHITDGNPRNKWVVRGYQHEIRNENKFPNISGFIYDEGGQRGRMALVGEKTTWSADGEKTIADEKLIDPKGFQELFKLDDWNDVVIIAKGNHIQHYMNGKLIMNCTDNDPRGAKEGILAVQLHAGNPMWVEYKNIRIKHLE